MKINTNNNLENKINTPSAKKSPKIIKLLTTSVSERTKWNRKKDKKLSKKVYVARFVFLDELGKRREKTKEFNTFRDADDYRREQLNRHERSGGREIEAENMTFNDLADHYEKDYAKEAQYVGERKVSGLRSLSPVKGYLKTLREHFGDTKLRKITHGMLRSFRDLRLDTPVVKNIKIKVPLTDEERKALKTRKKHRIEWKEESHPRQIASVNRELMTLRRMLNVAQTEGWIANNPFKAGLSLINMSDENQRNRILTSDEEKRLLEICDCDERRHLKAIIICLIDTGLRFSEMKTLTWEGVDFEYGVIKIKAFNSKTAKGRIVGITERLEKELRRLQGEQEILKSVNIGIQDDLVFGVKSNVNRSWRTARTKAGLEDLRLHDLRHTTGTRLARKGFTSAQIGRKLGHQQEKTTYRYINSDYEELLAMKDAMESYQTPEKAEQKS